MGGAIDPPISDFAALPPLICLKHITSAVDRHRQAKDEQKGGGAKQIVDKVREKPRRLLCRALILNGVLRLNSFGHFLNIN